MREYEIMLILPAEADDKVIGGVTDRISQVLGERGGQITNVNRWGRRRLAFPINKLTEGFYLVIEFEADPAALRELERVLSLVDEVVRFKVVVRPEPVKAAAPAGRAEPADTVPAPAGPESQPAQAAGEAEEEVSTSGAA